VKWSEDVHELGEDTRLCARNDLCDVCASNLELMSVNRPGEETELVFAPDEQVINDVPGIV